MLYPRTKIKVSRLLPTDLRVHKPSKVMVPISLATTSGSAALFAGAGSAIVKGTSAAAAALVLPAAVAALRGGGGGAAALAAGTAAATETAAKAFDLTRARIRLEGLSAYGVSWAVFSRCSLVVPPCTARRTNRSAHTSAICISACMRMSHVANEWPSRINTPGHNCSTYERRTAHLQHDAQENAGPV